MKFNFSYQKLLEHRKRLEDLAQKDFQESLAELNRQNEILQSLHQSIKDARTNAFQHEKLGGSQSEVLKQISEFIKGQEIRIERQKKKIQEAQQLVENKREILRAAAIEYKMMERLKEKHFEEFRKEKRAHEIKIMDDITTMRFKGEKQT